MTSLPQQNAPFPLDPAASANPSGNQQNSSSPQTNPQAALPSHPKPNFRDLSAAERAAVLEALGAQRFRARQIEEWLLKPELTSFDAMSNVPKALRETLAKSYRLVSGELVLRQVSHDGSRKYLVQLLDGTCVECVGLPSRTRLSVCISSQAGCAMGCAFCATGKHGFTRNLTAREMVEQVSIVRRDMGERVTSVVVMGQGEPFANYDATLQALRLLNAPGPETIGARHLTVSTAGIIPGIRRFAKEPEQFTLAVSLHSAIQSTRNILMPGLKRYPLARLHEALAYYTERTHRRPTYEFAVIAGVNNTNNEVRALVDFCRGTLCHVNLIRLNELNDSPFKPASEESLNYIQQQLERAGVEATIRESRGTDIDAACGQLYQQAQGVERILDA